MSGENHGLIYALHTDKAFAWLKDLLRQVMSISMSILQMPLSFKLQGMFYSDLSRDNLARFDYYH